MHIYLIIYMMQLHTSNVTCNITIILSFLYKPNMEDLRLSFFVIPKLAVK